MNSHDETRDRIPAQSRLFDEPVAERSWERFLWSTAEHVGPGAFGLAPRAAWAALVSRYGVRGALQRGNRAPRGRVARAIGLRAALDGDSWTGQAGLLTSGAGGRHASWEPALLALDLHRASGNTQMMVELVAAILAARVRHRVDRRLALPARLGGPDLDVVASRVAGETVPELAWQVLANDSAATAALLILRGQRLAADPFLAMCPAPVQDAVTTLRRGTWDVTRTLRDPAPDVRHLLGQLAHAPDPSLVLGAPWWMVRKNWAATGAWLMREGRAEERRRVAEVLRREDLQQRLQDYWVLVPTDEADVRRLALLPRRTSEPPKRAAVQEETCQLSMPGTPPGSSSATARCARDVSAPRSRS